jgi:hypothetical protein
MKKIKTEKMFTVSANAWWDGLTRERQEEVRRQYGVLRDDNAKKSHAQWPDMRDLSTLKLKDFSNKDIYCIYRFSTLYK